jgi:tRNA-2-methylthio-N6-dimethylallyladenosine synthase
MNEYDSDKMADVLRAERGMVPTDDPNEADVILFNTCSVRDKAQERCSTTWAGSGQLKLARIPAC